jgi:hypothetical protein
VIEVFKFEWNDKLWSAYFNALMREKIIVHFEDVELRDLFGVPLEYTKDVASHQKVQLNVNFPPPYNAVLSIIQDSIETQLGMSLRDFLLVEEA